MMVLTGRALFDGDEDRVHVQGAAPSAEGVVYLDLADPDWRAVAITPGEGWELVSNPPVRFKRARGMLALPAPVVGGAARGAPRVHQLRRRGRLSPDGRLARCDEPAPPTGP